MFRQARIHRVNQKSQFRKKEHLFLLGVDRNVSSSHTRCSTASSLEATLELRQAINEFQRGPLETARSDYALRLSREPRNHYDLCT
eukprot:2503639-Prymnesium_polylepis.1